MKLPNSLPRPPGELERLEEVWRAPSGWRFLGVVNNSYIGVFYVGTALAFLLAGGALAILMRAQLAFPENELLGPETYNQVFTVHGTVMMFLFAVPVMEAFSVFLLPNMLAARDLPFPRLSAFAYWAYAIGGAVFFCSIFFGAAPNAGWFMYPPLSSTAYNPGINSDFWLLGIGFIEISAIAGAIEIVVGVLRTRAPGMSLDKLPIYGWGMLVFAGMIIFAFPAVIVCTAFLELERAFDWPFFIAARGGDPLLWQHLFWFFGHPEVYIIFLPAAAMISTMLPTLARTPLVAYRLVVLALIATGFFSFGLWVHHMYTTGLPPISLSFFAAASMVVAIPSGIQVFAWIGTLWRGRPSLSTPLLFILGSIFIFVLGGMTGVMVASVPFDTQAHDSYFVVAHFHYVLLGGMVFPLFAALYYWIPTTSRLALSERTGRWVFWLMFVGFNVAFLPMHLTGLRGMPRRVYTYPEGIGWDWLNLLSTTGALLLASGILLFVFDVARRFRMTVGDNAGDVWRAGTLEWLPGGSYQTRSIPLVRTRDPLWEQPGLAEEVKSGQHFLPGTSTGRRETLVTSPIEARPDYVLLLPGASMLSFLTAIGTAGFFLLLTVKLVIPALLSGAFAIAMAIAWLWTTDPGPAYPPQEVGAGLRLPVYGRGSMSHSWWAMVVLLLVCGSIFFSLLFGYFFLWTVSAGDWPPQSGNLPPVAWTAAAGIVARLASSGLIVAAGRALARRASAVALSIAVGSALVLLLGGLTLAFLDHWQTGMRPEDHGYAAIVYATLGWQGVLAGALLVMGLYTIARSWCGLLGAERRATFDNTMLLWHYTVGQGLIGLAIIYLFPRFVE